MTEKFMCANRLVKKYAWLATGAGVIPLPLTDLLVVSGVQIKMLSALCQHYRVEFSEEAARATITALLGTLTAQSAAFGGASVIKGVPVFGTLIGVFVMPAFSGTVTYAIGKVFIQHFELGGSILDLNPEKMRHYFAEQFSNDPMA